MPVQLTDKDKDLLNLLRRNARATVTEIADGLGLSRSTVQKRLERLEDQGVIGQYTIRLSEKFREQEIRAHVLVTHDPKAVHSIIARLSEMRSVEEVHSVSGPFDLIVMLSALNVRELDQAIDAISELEGVERTTSSVILSTRFQR